jgi:hypothetical protein
MNLVVLIPSADYLENAGARIRYLRIQEDLAALGCRLEFILINEFEVGQANCDAILISKCHDARAIVCAIRAGEQGIPVGVDLFDDYFSQHLDSRMVRYRNWLSQLAPRLAFALCSTPTMAGVLRSYRTDLPVHIMNDPALKVDPVQLAQALHDKGRAFVDRQTLEVCWFGIGRNPHFPVGIHDLAAFGGALSESLRHGIKPQMTVLTNAQTLRAADLAAIRRLPVPVTVEIWSEAREAELLKTAHAAFIPVNAQSFSAAKSLNRAWTALAAGCQVISAGYPLYDELDPIIYRDINTLVKDFRSGRTRLHVDNLHQLIELHERLGSPVRESAKLFEFLAGRVENSTPRRGGLLGLIHGSATSGGAHKFAQRHGALAIRSPFCSAELGCDVTFWAEHPGAPLHVLLNQRAHALAEACGFYALVPAGRIGGRPVWSLPGSPSVKETPPTWSSAPVAAQMASYSVVVKEMQSRLVSLFGSIDLVISENSAWPFSFGFRAQL